jgi:hypothetical protein
LKSNFSNKTCQYENEISTFKIIKYTPDGRPPEGPRGLRLSGPRGLRLSGPLEGPRGLLGALGELDLSTTTVFDDLSSTTVFLSVSSTTVSLSVSLRMVVLSVSLTKVSSVFLTSVSWVFLTKVFDFLMNSLLDVDDEKTFGFSAELTLRGVFSCTHLHDFHWNLSLLEHLAAILLLVFEPQNEPVDDGPDGTLESTDLGRESPDDLGRDEGPKK